MLRIGEFSVGDHELDERFVRASGPGGQNVNKVATAVELRFDIPGSSLPDEIKSRLIRIAGKRVSAEGVLLIDSRSHRTQAQNRTAARARLTELIAAAAVRPKKRRPTKPKAGAKEERLASKKRRATVKAGRRTGADND